MRPIACAAMAALALAGCGDELEEFRDDVRPLEERAAEQRSMISAELRSLTLGSRGDARALRAGAAELAETYREIETLEPPGAYERPFTSYVRANERTIRELERFAAALAAGDARGLRRAGRDVVRHLGESQSARLRWLE